MMREGFVYIMTSKSRILYIGVTSNLLQRVYEHKNALVPGFTQKYHCHKLIYYEFFESIEDAIDREKQLKGWNRSKKLGLIHAMNPHWQDLSESLLQGI